MSPASDSRFGRSDEVDAEAEAEAEKDDSEGRRRPMRSRCLRRSSTVSRTTGSDTTRLCSMCGVESFVGKRLVCEVKKSLERVGHIQNHITHTSLLQPPPAFFTNSPGSLCVSPSIYAVANECECERRPFIRFMRLLSSCAHAATETRGQSYSFPVVRSPEAERLYISSAVCFSTKEHELGPGVYPSASSSSTRRDGMLLLNIHAYVKRYGMLASTDRRAAMARDAPSLNPLLMLYTRSHRQVSSRRIRMMGGSLSSGATM